MANTHFSGTTSKIYVVSFVSRGKARVVKFGDKGKAVRFKNGLKRDSGVVCVKLRKRILRGEEVRENVSDFLERKKGKHA